MVYREILRAISILEGLVERGDEILVDELLQGTLLWYLYVTVQGSIDLALKVISELRLDPPESYAEAFDILFSHGLISSGVRGKLTGMVKFRHILAHVYPRIQIREIMGRLKSDLEDVKQYLRELAENIKKFHREIEEF
ncbi:MAG: HepT-like ribonuclease domain-containing protein [Candidatus Jordarchaeales archaeon]|nr:DUF86 domain-containing protein [Candidatus Jordarchaeia archaeon]